MTQQTQLLEAGFEAVGYDVWNQALATFFYNPGLAKKPAYLQVDRDTLDQVAALIGVDSAQSELSLVRAVRSRLNDKDDHPNPFRKFLLIINRWKLIGVKDDPRTPPPFIGLLAVCVLAASRMSNDTTRQVTSGNYYVWLNDLLGFNREGAPPFFETVSPLWEELNWWLDKVNAGALGRATARTHPSFIHIGYPISQCLFSRADRQRLADFFRWDGLTPGQSVPEGEIARDLKIWVDRTTCTLSARAKQVFTTKDEQLLQQALQVVANELVLWDGISTDVEGRHLAEIRVRLEVYEGGHRYTCQLVPKAPNGFPDGTYKLGQQIIELKHIPDAPWFTPLPDELVSDALIHGLTCRQGDFVLVFREKPVLLLKEDMDLGGWISRDRISLGEEHAILCMADYVEIVQAFLEQHADPGWKKPTISKGLPESWACFRHVCITKVIQSSPEREMLDCLVPRLRVGVEFSKGLKLRPFVWLKGGEPLLQVSVLSGESEMQVYLDDTILGSVPAGGIIYHLTNFDLEPGGHEVIVGSERRRFHIVKPEFLPTTRSPQECLSHVLHTQSGQFLPVSLGPESAPQSSGPARGDQIQIIGARVVGLAEGAMLLVRREVTLSPGYMQQVILGCRPGEIVTVSIVQPALGSRVRKKVIVPFEPQWIIRLGRHRKVYLSSIGRPKPPERVIADESLVTEWKRWIMTPYLKIEQRRKHLPLWEQYYAVAVELDGVGV